MKLYPYKDYEEYRRLQTIRNKEKLIADPEIVWVEKEEIRLLSDYIRAALPEARFGLCHGTRRWAQPRPGRLHNPPPLACA